MLGFIWTCSWFSGVRIGEALNPGPPCHGLDDPEFGFGEMWELEQDTRCDIEGNNNTFEATGDPWQQPPDDRSNLGMDGPTSLARDGLPSAQQLLLDWATGFTPSKRFQGGVDGWCFRTGHLGTGY